MGIRKRVVFLDVAESVPWGHVVKVMDTIRGLEIRSPFINSWFSRMNDKLAIELAIRK